MADEMHYDATRRDARRRRLPRETRRGQIADAALELLARGGSGAVTLQALADRVGVTDASLLRHFASKDEIVEVAVTRFAALLDEDIPRDVDDPVLRLQAFIVRRLHKVRARPALMQLAYTSRLEDLASPKARRALVAAVGRSQRHVRECLEHARRDGRLAHGGSPETWMWAVIGVMRGASRATTSGALSRQSPESVWEALSSMLFPSP